MCVATSDAQHVVMDTHDLTRLVDDRRASREADACVHRMTKDIDEPTAREPRLRYERRHRAPALRRQSLTGG